MPYRTRVWPCIKKHGVKSAVRREGRKEGNKSRIQRTLYSSDRARQRKLYVSQVASWTMAANACSSRSCTARVSQRPEKSLEQVKISDLDFVQLIRRLSENQLPDFVEALEPCLVRPIGTSHGHDVAAERVSKRRRCGATRGCSPIFRLGVVILTFLAVPSISVLRDLLVATVLRAGGVPQRVGLHENDCRARREVRCLGL